MAQARNWLGTLNNPKVDPQEYLSLWHSKAKAVYVVGQLERGAEGTPHVQFFLNYKNSVRLAALKKHCKEAHFEPVKVNNGADTYCMKEDTRLDGPWEYGIKPVKRNSKADWEAVYEEAKKGNFDAIPADIKVKHYGNLCRIAKDHIVVHDAEDVRGIWIWGKSGIGKSRYARELAAPYGSFFPKWCNKWFDGYQQQPVIIMDDIDKGHSVLGHHLKIWTDRYGCAGEVKNGAIGLNHKLFIVTSQYHPHTIFEDSEVREAMDRRFKVIHMSDPLGIKGGSK